MQKSESVSLSVMSDSFATPWTVAYQAPLSMGFSRQEYWSGMPLPSPETDTGKGQMLSAKLNQLWASLVARTVKNLPASEGDAGDIDLIPGLGRSPREGNDPLQYSGLGNPMDRGAWWLTVHGFRHNLVKSDCKVWNNVSEQLLE